MRRPRCAPRPIPAASRAHVFETSDEGGDPLAAWIVASLALLAPGGRFVMIHRPEALAAILAAFGRRLGAVAIRPIHPRAEADAIRVLVSGVKGSRAPMRLLPGLALHEASRRLHAALGGDPSRRGVSVAGLVRSVVRGRDLGEAGYKGACTRARRARSLRDAQPGIRARPASARPGTRAAVAGLAEPGLAETPGRENRLDEAGHKA